MAARRNLEWWERMARSHVASGTSEQYRAIAQLCLDTELATGVSCGVWHSAAVVGGASRCWCAHCDGGAVK
jgi:hypothetical protein